MSVINGAPASAATFNAAFLSRLTDSDTVAIVSLLNAAVASGASITNIQRELNKLNSFNGSSVNTAYNALPTWTNNDVGLSTDPVKLRADNLTERFNSSTGHTHDGTAGEGPQISALDLANYNQYYAEWQTDVFTPAVGLSDDVTSVFTALAPGGGVATVGVPTSAPYNKTELRTDPSGDQIEEPGGRKVYGRLTEAAGTWTLTYYYEDSSGVETAYSLPSQDIRIYWREVFDSSTRPTFGEGFVGSFDATADIVDATGSVPGKVSISSQTFGGEKTFQDGAVFSKAISTTKLDIASGGTVTAMASTHSFVRFTGASTTELQGITAPSTAKRILVYNLSSGDLTLKHENAGATAVNRIITSDALDLVVAQYGATELIYDLSQSRWLVISTAGTGGGGSGFGETLGTGDGATTSFGPLSYFPTNANSIVVFKNGLETDVSEWSQSGSNILFGTAPTLATRVSVFYLTDGTPAVAPLAGTFKVEYRTLTGGEATAKSLTLALTPATPTEVAVDFIGGLAQFYGSDFTVTGAVLDWTGLGMDSIPLVAGDKLRIMYVS